MYGLFYNYICKVNDSSLLRNDVLTNTVKEFRTHHRMIQSDLAERVNVTRQTIVALEKGRYIPSLMLAMNIAKTFNLAIEEIFFLPLLRGSKTPISKLKKIEKFRWRINGP
jgi:putative transcriptional regulator